MTVPHAILVGGMKCGTTSLNAYIRQHPEIAAPKATKDMHFFSSEDNWAKGWDWYYGRWSYDPEVHRLRYESTTQYAKYPQLPEVAPRMSQLQGEVKLLYLLRDPLDRIESHLAHNVARGHATVETFRKTLPRAIEFSRYAMQAQRFLDFLPHAELLLLDFNELKHDPRGLLRKIEEFLGVSPFEYELVQPRNTRKKVNGSEQVKLTDADRQAILPKLDEDLRALRDDFGFDVSAWKLEYEPPTAPAPAVESVEQVERLPAVAPVSPPEDTYVTIAKHLGAKSGALSLTFDDGLRSHLDFAVPALDAFGFPGTFFVVGGRVRDASGSAPLWHNEESDTAWAEWRAALHAGHEIGNHTWSHPQSLTEVDDQQLQADVNAAYERMSEHLGRGPFSFAYPRQRVDDRVRKAVSERHGAAREKYKAYNPATSNCALEIMDARIDMTIVRERWFVPVMHVISGVENHEGIPFAEILLAHLEHVKRREHKLWIDTFGRIHRYCQKRDSATVSTKITEHGVDVEFNCAVDYPEYPEPLTLVVNAPRRAAGARYVDSGVPVPAQTSGDRLLLDVLPNQGTVQVLWRS